MDEKFRLVWNCTPETIGKLDRRFDRIISVVLNYFVRDGIRMARVATGPYMFSTPVSRLRIEKYGTN